MFSSSNSLLQETILLSKKKMVLYVYSSARARYARQLTVLCVVSAGGEDDRAVEGERERQKERSRDAPLRQLHVVK
jgi:hypothetical protein